MMAYTCDLRPCMVREKRAMFHGWAELEKPVIENNIVVGCIRAVNAVVELEDGSVKCVRPEGIRFLDTAEKMSEYDWTERTEDDT